MKDKTSFFKDNSIEIMLTITVIIIQFVLLENYIVGAFCFIVSFIFSLIFLKQKDKQRKQFKDKLSSYSFFLCFIKGIENEQGVKNAYDIASKYLIGYQNIIQYEDLSEDNTISLYSYQKYFDFIISKDRINQANMLLYRPLVESLNRKLNQMEESRNKIEMTYRLVYLLLISIIFVLDIITSLFKMEEIFKLNAYSILSILCFSFLMPFYHFAYLKSYGGLNNV